MECAVFWVHKSLMLANLSIWYLSRSIPPKHTHTHTHALLHGSLTRPGSRTTQRILSRKVVPWEPLPSPRHTARPSFPASDPLAWRSSCPGEHWTLHRAVAHVLAHTQTQPVVRCCLTWRAARLSSAEMLAVTYRRKNSVPQQSEDRICFWWEKASFVYDVWYMKLCCTFKNCVVRLLISIVCTWFIRRADVVLGPH